MIDILASVHFDNVIHDLFERMRVIADDVHEFLIERSADVDNRFV